MKRRRVAQDEPASRPPLERMMRIHAALKANSYPNASRLAADLEVCAKTIHRDLIFMRDRLGLPLAFDPARNGYAYTEAVDAFPSLQISEGELFALLVAEKALQQYRGTPFEDRLLGALRKLQRALPDTVSLNLSDWDHAISFRTSAEPIVDLPVMETLAQAVQQRMQLNLVYRKPGSAAEETRQVDPYHLANVNGDWYLFAFDHLRRAIRTFVPSRIRSATPTGRRFQKPRRFLLERQLRDSFGIFSTEGEYNVRIRFDREIADYIREKRWHASQEQEELPDGSLELRLRLGSLVEIQRWILGWGGRAQALAPGELVEGVQRAARELLQRHASLTPEAAGSPPSETPQGDSPTAG